MDGLLTAHHVGKDEIKFKHAGEYLATSGIEKWTAKVRPSHSHDAGKLLGEVRWNHDTGALDIIISFHLLVLHTTKAMYFI